jgi:mono/diheme cytochrome c family protein
MAAAEQPAKPVVELGNFSIVNPKPPGAPVLDGDFSVDDGNAAKGAKLFKAKCAACHTIKEGGAPCGPIRARRVGEGSGRAARELRTLVTRAPGLTTHL